MKKKKLYEQPETAVTNVELESPICSGSVQFGGDAEKNVSINNQSVTDAGNDFSNETWTIDHTQTNP